ncbi:hypothetical protein PFISCL1PPCAC_26677, partial [Pristionchus fissidentatus]
VVTNSGMSSHLAIRPPVEETQFDHLAIMLDIPKEDVVRCEKGLRRYIKKFMLGTANSLGKMEDHMVVLLNDFVIVAENAIKPRRETHLFDIQYNIPLRGLSVINNPGTLFLDHDKEGIHVVLEGKVSVVYLAYQFIHQEANSVNNVDHLPTSVVRPSRDPRHHRTSESGRRPGRITEEPLTIEQARELAAAEAQQRRRQLRQARTHQVPEIQEVTGDDDDIQIIEDTEMAAGIQFARPNVVVPQEPEEPRPNPTAEGAATTAFGTRIAEELFGRSAAGILKKHNLQFAGKVAMMDEFYQPANFRFIVFLDIFVIQRLNERRYEAFFCAEGSTFYDGRVSVELRWPHGLFTIELNPHSAQAWRERFNEAFMLAKATEDAKEESERLAPTLIGNCIVRAGRKSMGRTPPDLAPFERNEEEMRHCAQLMQVQNSLGATCDWLLCKRRRFITAAPMTMYAENGELETRRIILLSDKMLITKPAVFKTHDSHTHDIVDTLELLVCRVHSVGAVIHVRMPNYRRFMIAKDEQQAEEWAIEIRNVIQKAIEHVQANKARIAALHAAQAAAQAAALAMAQKQELARIQGQPHDVDPNLDQEEDGAEEEDMLIAEEDIEDETSNRPSSNGSYTGIVSDNEGDETMHANSPVGQRMNDFDDEEFDDDEDDSDEDDDDEDEEEDDDDIPHIEPLSEDFDAADFEAFEREQEARLAEERDAAAALQAVRAEIAHKRRAAQREEESVEPASKFPRLRLTLSSPANHQNAAAEATYRGAESGPAEPLEGAHGASPPRGDIYPSLLDGFPPGSSSERAMPNERRAVLGARPRDPRLNRGPQETETRERDEDRERIALFASMEQRLFQEERILTTKRGIGEGSSKPSTIKRPVEE